MRASRLTRRPQVHLTAASGWINDPYGLTFRNGTYHVFFQYVPGSTAWSLGCHWGHATSPDLLIWTEQPPALFPGDGDDGVWSGSVVDAGDGAQLFYTSVRRGDPDQGRVRRAVPLDPDWTGWRKQEVVVEAPEQLAATAFRDPFVFADGDRWRMLVGSSLPGEVAAATSYSSVDLLSWSFDGIAAQRPSADRAGVWTGSLWECPQIFELDGRHVLVTSVCYRDLLHYAAYAVGDYADGVFVAQTWRQLTFGRGYYAPSFFRDRDGQACLVLWMSGLVDARSDWAGALSVPHRLGLDGDRLVLTPHPALLATAAHTVVDGRHELASDAPQLLTWAAAPGASLEIGWGDQPALTLTQTPVELHIRAGDGETTIIATTGPVTVLLDGPCVEIWTREGLFGLVAPLVEADLAVVIGRQ